MALDFESFFNKYEALLKQADEIFRQIEETYPENVTCKIGCSDCCHALFDLTLIEALYINVRFNKELEENKQRQIIEKANRADREIYRLKRKAFKTFNSGVAEAEILEMMAKERVRCPLLNETEQCDLYPYRPITCRYYGLPTQIGGTVHICGKTGFVTGEKYTTVRMDRVQQKLYELSKELTDSLKSRYVQLSEILLPLSMAILTEFNEDYLGVSDASIQTKE